MKKNKIILWALSLVYIGDIWAADPVSQPLRIPLSKDEKQYLQFTLLNQVWLRGNESNAGTTVLGDLQKNTVDLGLRRTRFQLFGEIAPKTFVYFQFGQNNFNRVVAMNANRKNTFFIHDALCEYRIGKSQQKIGGGLTIANGLSRFSQPSISTIVGLDVPVFAQATVDQTDQFSRKLSVYSRGQVGKVDYRFVFSDPFPVQSNGAAQPILGDNASFALKGHHWQYQGMFSYQFFEHEQNQTPYMLGTYLGDKKVFNISVGGIYQKGATWNTESNGVTGRKDTVFNNMILLCAESFLDMPMNKGKGTAIHAYLGYFSTNYGHNYVRYNGIMNPATGTAVTGLATDAGGQYGNAFPMFGTGNVIHGQFAYVLPKDLLGKDGVSGKLQLYTSATSSRYVRFNNQSLTNASVGMNWLMPGNRSKITLDVTNRAAVALTAGGDFTTERKNTITVQYQINI